MTSYIIPAVIMLILILSMKKTAVYNTFINGVAGGMKTVADIFPPILAILTATAMLDASGAFGIFIDFISPVTNALGIPEELMPLAVVRPISGGASLGVLADMLEKYGADTLVAIAASVIMGSTETTFYTLCVYFKKTRVKYTKKIIPAALIGDFVGLIAAVWVCKIIF